MARRESSARRRGSSPASPSAAAGASGCASTAGSEASARRVSRLSRPLVRRRALPITKRPASASRTRTPTMIAATLLLQLEEDSVVPREDEVEALTAEERADDDERSEE